MKRIIVTIFMLFSLSAFAQRSTMSDSAVIFQLQQDVRELKTELRNQKTYFSNRLSVANDSIKLLRSETEVNKTNIDAIGKDLGLQISDNRNVSDQQIQSVRETISKNTLYWIIAVLAVLLLSTLLFSLLRRRLAKEKIGIIEQLSQTKSAIEESLVKEFVKQTELMETQMAIIKQQKTDAPASANTEPDHSLALKVASEINLIERNISLMDAGTKGLKQLNRSMEKLKDNLAANGYEIPQLLGKQFHQGMKIIVASSIPDDSLEKGTEVITKILIPQVNYNGKMIQTAQIEVSVGY